MPFARRDETGRIVAVYDHAVEDGLEPVDPHDPELLAFVSPETGEDDHIQRSFQESDIAFIRVLEDLIDVLIQKGYLQFSDFPEGAQQKLMTRQGLRREYAYLQSLFGSTDDGGYGDGGGWL